jgi:hypothetical protein
MSKLMIALFVTAGLSIAGTGSAQTYSVKNTSLATPMTKTTTRWQRRTPTRSTRSTRMRVRRLNGNAKDICVAEAKGKDNVAKADAEASYANTPKARESARVAHAKATYDVSVEKCDDLAGNRKDVCVKEAKAALVSAKADAKVDRVAVDTRKDATAKQVRSQQGSERG